MKHQAKTVILCESYDEVPSCLDVIGQVLARNHDVLIVTFGNEDLFRLFSEMNDKLDWKMRVEFVGLFPRNAKKNKGRVAWALEVILEAFEERSYYRKKLKDLAVGIQGGQIYFFTRFINAPTQLFVEALAKRNTVMFRQVVEFRDVQPIAVPRSVSEAARVLRQWLIYGGDFIFARAPHRIMEYISDDFLWKYVSTWITAGEEGCILDGCDFSKWNVWPQQRFSVVYFDQPLAKTGRVRESEYREDLCGIFSAVSKYVESDAIAIKYHPGMHSDTDYIKVGVEVPRYIPGEFLCRPEVKVYMSFSSGAITRIGSGVVVSLIELVRFVDPSAKEYIKRRLIERSAGAIRFPESINALEDLLKGLFGTSDNAESVCIGSC